MVALPWVTPEALALPWVAAGGPVTPLLGGWRPCHAPGPRPPGTGEGEPFGVLAAGLRVPARPKLLPLPQDVADDATGYVTLTSARPCQAVTHLMAVLRHWH